jgi:hypothetical protein
MRYLAEHFPREIRFTDFESYLDHWIPSMDQRPVDQNRRAYERFRDYYFRHNQDPEREARITAWLASRGR